MRLPNAPNTGMAPTSAARGCTNNSFTAISAAEIPPRRPFGDHHRRSTRFRKDVSGARRSPRSGQLPTHRRRDHQKDHLIEQALEDGIYDRPTGRDACRRSHSGTPRTRSARPPGIGVACRPGQTTVHEPQRDLAIEGILTWEGEGPRLFRDLADSQYNEFEVYGVDIGQAGAREQAPAWWWQGRQLWVNNADPLGADSPRPMPSTSATPTVKSLYVPVTQCNSSTQPNPGKSRPPMSVSCAGTRRARLKSQ